MNSVEFQSCMTCLLFTVKGQGPAVKELAAGTPNLRGALQKMEETVCSKNGGLCFSEGKEAEASACTTAHSRGLTIISQLLKDYKIRIFHHSIVPIFFIFPEHRTLIFMDLALHVS